MVATWSKTPLPAPPTPVLPALPTCPGVSTCGAPWGHRAAGGLRLALPAPRHPQMVSERVGAAVPLCSRALCVSQVAERKVPGGGPHGVRPAGGERAVHVHVLPERPQRALQGPAAELDHRHAARGRRGALGLAPGGKAAFRSHKRSRRHVVGGQVAAAGHTHCSGTGSVRCGSCAPTTDQGRATADARSPRSRRPGAQGHRDGSFGARAGPGPPPGLQTCFPPRPERRLYSNLIGRNRMFYKTSLPQG